MIAQKMTSTKIHGSRGAVALSKHLALPGALCLRFRGAFLTSTDVRRGSAAIALRRVPTQPPGALRQRSAIPGSSLEWFPYRLFQFTKAVIAALLFISSIPTAGAVSLNNDPGSYVKIEISMVNFNMTTIRAVPCNEFTQIFGQEMKTVFVKDKTNIARFNEIFKKLKPGVGGCPDTRAKVLIHYQNGHTDILCVAHTGISLNEKPMLPSKEMVEFIENIVIRQGNGQ